MKGGCSSGRPARHKPMKIKVPNIPEEGQELHFSREGKKFLELIPDKEKAEFSLDAATVTCFVRKNRNSVSLKAEVQTGIGLQCSRCLEAVTHPVRAAFAYTLVPEGTGAADEDSSVKDEDLNVGHYREETIDLDVLVLEQIVLQIPIKPLCRADCKGLCPYCGTNLNDAACGCDTHTVDSRFAVLKNFKAAK